jgi:hypothetical protein
MMDASGSLRLARMIRAACAKAAIEAHEDAGVQGLCAEGRFEAAIGAMDQIDLQDLLRRAEAEGNSAAPTGAKRT